MSDGDAWPWQDLPEAPPESKGKARRPIWGLFGGDLWPWCTEPSANVKSAWETKGAILSFLWSFVIVPLIVFGIAIAVLLLLIYAP